MPRRTLLVGLIVLAGVIGLATVLPRPASVRMRTPVSTTAGAESRRRRRSPRRKSVGVATRGPVRRSRPQDRPGRRRGALEADAHAALLDAQPVLAEEAHRLGIDPVLLLEDARRAARMLALAHYVERLVDEGAVASYADAARKLGVSRARMSQIMNLLNLPAPVQERLLLGDLHLSERRLRSLAGRVEWEGHQGTG